MKNRRPCVRLFLLIICLFFLIPTINAQKNKRISFEVSPLYSYIDVRLGEYSVRNNPGIEDPQPGFGGAIQYEVDLNNLLSLSAGLRFERRQHAYASVLYDTASPAIYLGDKPPYKLTYDDSYDIIGIPVALHINYLNHSTFRLYQSFGTQFGFLAQKDHKGEWFYEDKATVFQHEKSTEGKTDVVVSLTSSIGVCKNITKNVAFKLEPGISYMATNFFENSWAHMRYFDLKVDMGIVFLLNSSQE